MFDIDLKYRTIFSRYMEISDNFHVFHYDEFPILFGGTNVYGNTIIGSLVCENDDGDIQRYFHSVISNKTYNEFIKQKISYRDLLQSLDSIFVIDKSISNKVIDSFNIESSIIPVEYLPFPNVFCPNVEKTVGFEYSLSLKGGFADIHEALSNTLSNISKSTDKMFNNFSNVLKIKDFNAQVHQLAYSVGSFRINFRIKIQNPNLFFNESLVREFYQKCLDYSINSLPAEAVKLANGEVESTKFKESIIPVVKEVYKSYFQKAEESDVISIANVFIDSIDEIESISKEVGKGFKGIEIIGYTNDRDEVSIGYIDKEFHNEIIKVSQVIEQIPQPNTILDSDYKDYKIQVYDLNTDTRKGTAHINNVNDIMDNPKIIIEGEEELSGSIFTESLHLNKWIVVKAKAKTTNGKYKSLSISYKL